MYRASHPKWLTKKKIDGRAKYCDNAGIFLSFQGTVGLLNNFNDVG
jgi:hypothetical protein